MQQDHIQVWADAIHSKLLDLSVAHAERIDSQHADFYRFAGCIVEPPIMDTDTMDAYCQFTEENTENWVEWIRNTFGEAYGKIARVVAEEGY